MNFFFFFHVRVETNFMLENEVIYDKMKSYETIYPRRRKSPGA